MEVVVRRWLKVNSDSMSDVTAESLRRRLRIAVPRENRETISEVLDQEGFDVNHSDRGGSYSQKFECGFCGESVKDMASHLPECTGR